MAKKKSDYIVVRVTPEFKGHIKKLVEATPDLIMADFIRDTIESKVKRVMREIEKEGRGGIIE